MVFQTVVNMVRARGPDGFWRKRKFFRLAAHYVGRRRNCFSITIRNVHRALVYATKARQLKKEDMRQLWETRISAACGEHNVTDFTFKEGLNRCNIVLNRKILADLAIWEPRTFSSLAALAKEKIDTTDLDIIQESTPTGKDPSYEIMLRGKLNE